MGIRGCGTPLINPATYSGYGLAGRIKTGQSVSYSPYTEGETKPQTDPLAELAKEPERRRMKVTIIILSCFMAVVVVFGPRDRGFNSLSLYASSRRSRLTDALGGLGTQRQQGRTSILDDRTSP